MMSGSGGSLARGASLCVAVSCVVLSGCTALTRAWEYVESGFDPAVLRDEQEPPEPQTPTDVAAESEPAVAVAEEPIEVGEIVTREDGLAVQSIRTGDGLPCEPDSLVIIQYEGRLEDGTVVDSGRANEPWPLSQLIPGLRDGLLGLQAGGSRRITIPSALSYGDSDVADPETGEVVIPAGATLVYTVALLEVVSPKEQEAGE